MHHDHLECVTQRPRQGRDVLQDHDVSNLEGALLPASKVEQLCCLTQ